MKGSRTTAVVILVGCWQKAVDGVEEPIVKQHSAFAGRLLERLLALRGIRGVSPSLDVVPRWKRHSAQWSITSTPGELGEALRVGAGLFAGLVPSPGELLQERAKIELERSHSRVPAGWDGIRTLLYGREEAVILPPDFDPELWASRLRNLADSWLRPEHCTLVVMGPHSPVTVRSLVDRAFGHFSPKPAAPRDPAPPRASLEARQETRECGASELVPSVYAFPAPNMAAYKGAPALLVQSARGALARRAEEQGISLTQWVAATEEHVCGVLWTEPALASQALETLRLAFSEGVEQLNDPTALATAKKRHARLVFRRHGGTPTEAAEAYSWLDDLYPDALNPYSMSIRAFMSISQQNIQGMADTIIDGSDITTIQFRPDQHSYAVSNGR